MSALQDPIRIGLSRGWSIKGGPFQAPPKRLVCDVAIIGSGAGGGITAELLSKAGLQVVIIEEGPLRSSSDFDQTEASAYPALYQESGARKTRDKAINILQGRCVGGSTTVNWTSSFRTPDGTLAYWREQLGLRDFSTEALAPFFTQAESRLNISPWNVEPNPNNKLLLRGAEALGMHVATIPRNVRGCWNLGSCGMGCPTNAKQSMLVTTIPAALDQGATLLVQMRAQHFDFAHGKVASLLCAPTQLNGDLDSGRAEVRVLAQHYVLAGGAVNSPAVLLRSEAPDPHGVLGRRTFVHPVVMSAAVLQEKIEGWHGAPQSVYSDHFLRTQPLDGPIGFKIESAPLHPVIFASSLPGFGQDHAKLLRNFPHTQVLIALMRDGFHEQSPGGQVQLRSDGSPMLDYPVNDFILEGVRRAFLAMAQIQFVAGATQVLPVHEHASPYASWQQARQAVEALRLQPLATKLVSAHVMGGCAIGRDERYGVVDQTGRHWQIENLSIHDGSIFPTSIGTNPQLSIYAVTNRLAQLLARKLAGKEVTLA